MHFVVFSLVQGRSLGGVEGIVGMILMGAGVGVIVFEVDKRTFGGGRIGGYSISKFPGRDSNAAGFVQFFWGLDILAERTWSETALLSRTLRLTRVGLAGRIVVGRCPSLPEGLSCPSLLFARA